MTWGDYLLIVNVAVLGLNLVVFLINFCGRTDSLPGDLYED